MTDFGATQRVPSSGQKVFQRYTLKKILGRGGMGIVWLAHDDKLDRNVALKFLPDVVVHDPRAIDELKREARRNLDLTHPHIVRIYDFVDDTDGAAIAMEYVKGDSLSKLALSQPDGTFSMGRLRPWMQQFCAALTYAHEEAKVVHRDLKPANLMLDGQDRVKITDFGIARSIAESVSRVSAQAGSSGTPSYMSPQQMMGELPSVADDIYSLGATLYELLTGRPPFFTGDIIAQVQGKVPPSVMQRRKELNLADPPLGGPVVSPEWEATLAACLKKERHDRPQSAAEVAEMLGVKERDSSARRVTVRPPPAPSGVTLTPPPPPPTAATLSSPASEPATKTPVYVVVGIGVVLVAAAAMFWGSAAKNDRAPGTAYTPGNRPPPAATATQPVNATVPAAVPAATPAPLPATGGVVIRSDPPGGEITIVGVDKGRSPLTSRDIKPGKYPVKVELAGYDDWSGQVEVKAGMFGELNATLVHHTGRVTITGTPSGAEVMDGDKRLGTLPLTLDKFPTGPVRLTVRAHGFQPATLTGELGNAAELKLSAALDKIPVLDPAKSWTVGELKLTMQPIPAGSFTMGSAAGDRDEKPVEQVTISQPFWMGRTEITQAQWSTVMERNPSSFKEPDHPVEQISWSEAVEFCRRMTERGHKGGWLPAGFAFALPTEAQWEYACRAGSADDFGGNIDAVGWYSANTKDETQAVGGKDANAWGLVDMHGNVWEWCLDWYDKYPGGALTDPTGAATGTRRVIRGGSWSSTAARCRASVRDAWKPNERGNGVGFRMVVVTNAAP